MPGARQKWRTGAYDPAVVPDLRAWLTARLGELARFEVNREWLTRDLAGRITLRELPDFIDPTARPLRDAPRQPWTGPSRLLTAGLADGGRCWPGVHEMHKAAA